MALNDELMHHIQLKSGDVGRYVFLPGDPGRCEKIASYFDNPQLMAYNREYKTYTGTLLGEKVSVTSTGIGGPSTAIAIEELVMIGADTFIRVGTSGGMQPYLHNGDLAVVSGAVRDEGTTLHYLPPEFPAVAHIDVVNALRQAAVKLNQTHYVGIVQSKDSFYGQHQPERMPVASRLLDRWKAFVDGGALSSEMEASTVFILSSMLRVRAGAIMMIGVRSEDEEKRKAFFDLSGLIGTAIEAAKILIEQDREG